MTTRAGQLTHGGIRLRAAAEPDRQREDDAERRSRARRSAGFPSSPLTSSSQRAKLGGNIRAEEARRRCAMPTCTRSHEMSICDDA